MKNYYLDRNKVPFTDKAWHDLLRASEGYPEFCDMFDRGELLEDYETFRQDTYWLANGGLRITTRTTLDLFLRDVSGYPATLVGVILSALAEYDYDSFCFGGNGDGVGLALFQSDDVIENNWFFADFEDVDAEATPLVCNLQGAWYAHIYDLNYTKDIAIEIRQLAEQAGQDLSKHLNDFIFSIELAYQNFHGLDSNNWDKIKTK